VTAEPSPARPAPLEPGAAYSRASGAQAAGLMPAVELFEQSAKDVELPHPPQPIVIADYGASAGHNSLLPIGVAIAALRKRAEPGRAIFVMHADVAENNYMSLFQMLANDPHSYLRDDPATFSAAIGRSFYQQILPSNSVTLGWSSWAVQWLSRVPRPVPDHVQVCYSHDSAVRSAYARLGAADWIAFLTARSRELVPGGHLVALTMALDHGDFGYRPLLEGIAAELDEMVTEGVITGGEARRMTIPTVGRSEADLTLPFAPKNRFSGLTIEDLEVFVVEDPYWTRYEKDRDADSFAAGWTAFGRSSVFKTLATSLEGGLEDPRAGRFVDRLSAGVQARLAAAPEPFRLPLAKLLVVKQAWPR